MTTRVDFTAHDLPSMAVACPQCGASVGAYCRRPSGHAGPMVGIHRERHAEADRIHDAQGGGWIVKTPAGDWLLVPLDADRTTIPAALAKAIAEVEAEAPAPRRAAPPPAAPPAPRQGALF